MLKRSETSSISYYKLRMCRCQQTPTSIAMSVDISKLTVTQNLEKTSLLHGSCTDAVLRKTAFQTHTYVLPLEVRNRNAALKAYPREQ